MRLEITPEPTIYKTFQFSRTITHVEWSPDSKYLLVNLGFDMGRPGYQTEFSLINIASGEVVFTRKHRDGPRDVPVNAIGWMTDSKRFITATPDGLLYVWNLKGEVVDEKDLGEDRFVDKMCMVPGQNAAVISTNDNKVEVFSFEGEETRHVDTMTERPAAMLISPDGSYLSISTKANADLCRPAQILIYDFTTLTFLRALEADSYVNEMFIIMPTYCGPHFEILCAGSENGKLHFWDVETGEMILVLEEHSKHSGWSAFHPTMPGLMASCSDDNHIILWVTKDLSRALQDEDEKWLECRRTDATLLPPIDIKKGW
ncbi:WD repeat-containing protein 26 [Mortierella claussenii]|nr:WD repeat-containing protein 26 [Mortierella claussenii]